KWPSTDEREGLLLPSYAVAPGAGRQADAPSDMGFPIWVAELTDAESQHGIVDHSAFDSRAGPHLPARQARHGYGSVPNRRKNACPSAHSVLRCRVADRARQH